MQTPIAKIITPLATTITVKSLLQNIQPGQILQGTALSENINGSMRLQIGLTRLTAQTSLSVSPGQRLTLQVEKAGDLPELRVLTLPSRKELMALALKSNLPRQQPLPELFKALTQSISNSAAQPLPPPVKQAVQQLLARIVSVNDPNFKSVLSNALQLSGTQAESQLIRQAVVNNDLKLNLLRLIGLVKPYINQQGAGTSTLGQSPAPGQLTAPGQSPAPGQPATPGRPAAPGQLTATGQPASKLPDAPPQLPIQPQLPITPHTPAPTQSPEANPTVKLLLNLFKHLDGAIARIQTNQLSSLPAEDPARQVWQFELPIRQENGFDLFHIRIAPENGSGDGDAEAGWQLTLHMNMQPLGPMKVRLHLLGETLSTVIWSEKPETLRLVKQHIDRLRSGFESAGLEVKKLEAFQGSAKNEQELPNDHSLLNEQA